MAEDDDIPWGEWPNDDANKRKENLDKGKKEAEDKKKKN